MWPRTLFGRTALIIAAALVIAQATFLWLVHLSLVPLRTLQLASLLENDAVITSAALRALPPAHTEHFLQALNARGLEVTKESPPAHGRRAPFFGPIVRHLTAHGYPASALATHTGVRVTMRLDDHQWLQLIVPGRPPLLPWARLGFLAVGLIVTMVGALLLVRRVNRPLAALATAATSFGEGHDPPPLPVHGPTEIARVCAAFNRMTADARRHERDRALLLAGVSHDLRTPLARLRLAVELLGADGELRTGMIQDIEEMDGILAEFLAYVRHGVEENVAEGDINALIAEIAGRYRRRGNDILFAPQPAPRFPYRPLATTRLITNLVDNACRHAAGTRITVATEHKNGWMEVVIADRGPGLTAAQRDHFAQGAIPTEPHRRGLGLVIARRIAQAQGGSLALEAREGGGLVARVRLPLAPPLLEGAAGTHTHRLQDPGERAESRE